MTTPPFRRLAVLAAPAVLALGLAACGGSDVSRADVQEELERGDVSREQAACIADELFDQLDQEQIDELYEADTAADLDDEVEGVFTAASERCAPEG